MERQLKNNPSEFRHKIQVYKNSIGAVDEDGIPVDTPVFYKDLKAKVVNLKTEEEIKGGATIHTLKKKFIVRKNNLDICENDFIKYKDKIFNIESVKNLFEKDKEYEISAKVVL